MKYKDSNQYGKTSADDIKRFEFQIGAIIPDQYRDFLLEHNGGKPIPSDFQLSKGDGSSLHHVFGLHSGPNHSNLLEHFEVFKGRIPKDLLSIADDPFGNQICIGISKKNFGKVYFWDHEKEGSFFSFGNTALLAKSFNDFLDGLFEYVDPNETDVDRIIRLEDIAGLKKLIEDGYDIESIDENDVTIIEKCTVHRRNELIRFLYEMGAKLRSSLKIAESNAKYFEEHKETVALLKNLSQGE